MSEKPKKLLAQVRDALRDQHYSIHTEKTYVGWITRYILFHNKRHPQEMGLPEIQTFLTHLAVEKRMSASTQNQALSALLFLYRRVLQVELEGAIPLPATTQDPVSYIRARRPGQRVPNTLTRKEVAALLDALSGVNQLIASLLYGSGLRLIECLRLRIVDLDLARHQITVRARMGMVDHVTMLPESLVAPLQTHLQHVKTIHQRDLEAGRGAVYLPPDIEEQFPDAHRQWRWQYAFPSRNLSHDPRSDARRRHHLDPSGPQKAVRKAVQTTGLDKFVSCRTLRDSFATHLLDAGYDVRTVQELLGHKDVKTTMVYSNVLNRGVTVRSPLD